MSRQQAKLTGTRKRDQIESANKTVFLWAIAAAAALALCAVVGYFLIKEISFNAKILGAKNETYRTLEQNVKNAETLEQNIQSLIANNDLAQVKANSSDSNYKVVLDALPVSSDPTVLGSSLLQEILNRSNVRVVSLTTAPGSLGGMMLETQPGGADGADSSSGGSEVTAIPFNFAVQGNYSQVSRMLQDLERSIRPMNVRQLVIQGSDSALQVNVRGESYYSTERTVELGKKQVKP